MNVQLCFNSTIEQEAPYYRLKESYRDVRGNVHFIIVLNIGFEPSPNPLQVKHIARALILRFQNRNNASLFPENQDGFSLEEHSFVMSGHFKPFFSVLFPPFSRGHFIRFFHTHNDKEKWKKHTVQK